MIYSSSTNTGFDSLLDTMTNAVGILIIVLAVSYMVMTDTVGRVSQLDPSTSYTSGEEYSRLQNELTRLNGVLEELEQRWKESQRSAELVEAQVDQVKNRIGPLEDVLTRVESRGLEFHDVENGLASRQPRPRLLQDKVDQLKRQLKQLQQAIKLQRSLPEPKVTVARVPDPVPAPKGAERIVFLCRYARVVFYPTGKMLKKLHDGIAAGTESKASIETVKMTDFGKLVEYFRRNEIGAAGFRWRLSVVRRTDASGASHRDLKAFLEWGPDEVGEGLEEIQQRHSQYRKTLGDFAKKHGYAKYYVWGDSFPEYAIAREIIDEHHIPAGWVAMEGNAEYILVVSSTQTGRKRLAGPEKIKKAPEARRYSGGGGGIPSGAGAGLTPTPAIGAGSIGVIGASHGGDFVD